MLVLCGSLLAACASAPHKPIPTVEHVDLPRFMGDWYVIANIPTFLEEGAHNAVERYRLIDETTVATTFSFNQDGFDGKRKVYHPTGYVEDTESNAVWGMQFWWPFVSEYRIVYLDPQYTQTIIGRSKRDYVWIMARSPHISQQDYFKLLDTVTRLGYDPEKVQRVPQRWDPPATDTDEASR
jgi:apolipoprotein D and lipocalin family protein